MSNNNNRDEGARLSKAITAVNERDAAEVLRDRFRWRTVEVPRVWNPKEIGEELLGYYGGRTCKNGPHGQYEVVIIHVPYRGAMIVSGTEIIQLVDAALVQKGHPLRIIWRGREKLASDNGWEKKRFELQVAEGDPLHEEDLPQVRNS